MTTKIINWSDVFDTNSLNYENNSTNNNNNNNFVMWWMCACVYVRTFYVKLMWCVALYCANHFFFSIQKGFYNLLWYCSRAYHLIHNNPLLNNSVISIILCIIDRSYILLIHKFENRKINRNWLCSNMCFFLYFSPIS